MIGIYKLTIAEQVYIGKDCRIEQDLRKKDHLRNLRRNSHYNPRMQKAWNDHPEDYTYEILYQCERMQDINFLCEIEIDFITSYNSFKKGLNMTEGGEGRAGRLISEKEKALTSIRMSGEKNYNAKLNNEKAKELIQDTLDGMSNEEIGSKYQLHPRYVSLIRHKKRFKIAWLEIDPENKLETKFSPGWIPFSVEEIEMIEELILTGKNNLQIAKLLGRSSRQKIAQIRKELQGSATTTENTRKRK